MGTEVLRPQDYLLESISAMGTEVLRPQDYLLQSGPALRSHSSHPKQIRRRREALARQSAKPRLAMGQVTILRRGETLEAAKARGNPDKIVSPTVAGEDFVGLDPVLFGVGPLGPEPAMIPKEIRLKPPTAASEQMQGLLYAGTAFDLSPSPRALPLPSFSNRKGRLAEAAPAVVDSSASMDLRRLLRLE